MCIKQIGINYWLARAPFPRWSTMKSPLLPGKLLIWHAENNVWDVQINRLINHVRTLHNYHGL